MGSRAMNESRSTPEQVPTHTFYNTNLKSREEIGRTRSDRIPVVDRRVSYPCYASRRF